MQSSIFLSVPSQDKLGGSWQEGHPAWKLGGLMEVDCWLVWMEWLPLGLSVCLPLVMLPNTIKSRRRFLLAPAYPGGSRKGRKRLWCGGGHAGCSVSHLKKSAIILIYVVLHHFESLLDNMAHVRVATFSWLVPPECHFWASFFKFLFFHINSGC